MHQDNQHATMFYFYALALFLVEDTTVGYSYE